MEFKILVIVSISTVVLIGIYRLPKLRKKSNEITKKYNWKTDKEKFKKDFEKILLENPNLNYLVIDFSKFYIQYMGWENSNEFYCEAMSNEFLEEPNKLDDLQIKKLVDLNFSEPNTKDSYGNSSPNFSKYHLTQNETEISKIFEELNFIMNKIYKIKSNEIIQVRYG